MVFNNTPAWAGVSCQLSNRNCFRSTCMTAARGQQSAKHRLSLNIEPISDRDFRSLYRKIFWQLNSTSISYIAPLCSVAVRYNKSISIIETVISIDYRYIYFLASYFSDRSRGIDRVGDNWRTVNTSANPHISDQLTELENRIHVLNTVMLIYRHDMSCGLQ